MANSFIDTARQSAHKPESMEEELALEIYDVPLVFSIRFEVRHLVVLPFKALWCMVCAT